MYYNVIKHDRHLRTREKCRKRELRLFHFLYDIEVMGRKTIKHPFSMFHTLIKHVFSTNQSARRFLSIQ